MRIIKFYEIEGSGGGREALYDAYNREVFRSLKLEKEIKRLKSNFEKAIDEAYGLGVMKYPKWQAILKIKKDYNI